MAEIVIVIAAYAAFAGWCYWRHCERNRIKDSDRAYWDRVRRECPNCAERRKHRQGAVST